MAIPAATIRSRVKPKSFPSLTMASQVDETLRRWRPKQWPARFDNSMSPGQRTPISYNVRTLFQAFGELDLHRPQRRRRSRLHNFHSFQSLIGDRYRQEFRAQDRGDFLHHRQKPSGI